jgi:uncharacterized protein (DUF2236 family)
MAVVARLFGIPADLVPPTLRYFRAYFDSQLASGTITATPIAREIAKVVLRAPLPVPLRMFAPAHRLAAAALLPPSLRRQYRLRWTPLHALMLEPAARSVKLTATPLMLAAARLRPPASSLAA